ncbi:TIGR03643 family protein [Epilithonimonas ginsengisoli]|uniref:TIGR03643 family protein n=1 Tax=Epilithonimonas ginsengisoli TaxID=1245592 RepID=A0ABU4JJY2_9FLAO|nr:MULTISPECIES: TIGR03643 family protein [Chryseobacterium group]MBV6881004.1 TIGR03643 family protein [Epilithonimonas sp. FP105]MDW8549894.1 TIGR03643 family protein [Epilithonimonas ginsengisoli]OAH73518.1 RNA methyltransferase [Chryseobacterium sp. FP211-J200]
MKKEFNLEQKDRIIEMAWEDRTPFEAIKFQFSINESEVIELMRTELKQSSFKLWRKRVNSGVSRKHLMKRNPEIARFKCSRQRTISHNKISKR